MVCFHWTEISQACSGLRPLLLYRNHFDEWTCTLTTLLKKCAIHMSYLRNMKGGGIERLLVSVPLSVVCACVHVCVCLHCPHIGSDDSTMLTSQDALTFKTYSITSCQLSTSCVNRPVSLWGGRGGDSALSAGGHQTGGQTDRQACGPPAVSEEFSLCWNGDAAKNNIKRQQQQGSFLSHQSSGSL